VITKRLEIGVVGSTGQLAKAIKNCQAEFSVKAKCVGRDLLDLSSQPNDLRVALSVFDSVDVIINAAAYNAVDQAEEDQDTAFAVNAKAPGIIATYCKANQIPLVHISTDYIFNGQTATPYNPEHPADPLGAYGASKYQGELAVKGTGCHYAVLRTSWVYDADSKNFMTTMLHRAASGSELNVVHDQIGRPTLAKDLAHACIVCAAKLVQDAIKYTGTYHVSGTGAPISWADFAREIIRLSGISLERDVTINNILSSDYPTRAKRPSYSVLNTQSFEQMFDIQLPDWHLSLNAAIKQWHEKNGEVACPEKV